MSWSHDEQKAMQSNVEADLTHILSPAPYASKHRSGKHAVLVLPKRANQDHRASAYAQYCDLLHNSNAIHMQRCCMFHMSKVTVAVGFMLQRALTTEMQSCANHTNVVLMSQTA